MSEPGPTDSPHEFKALLLFVLILAVVAFTGSLAYLRYGPGIQTFENSVTYAADGSMLVSSDGNDVKIRRRSTGAILVARVADPIDELAVANTNKATTTPEYAEKIGLTKLQLSALRQINITSSGSLTRSQMDVIETAYSLYVNAGGAPVTVTTRPATTGKALGGPAETGLLEAVARLSEDSKFVPYWRRVQRIRQVVTPEQFDMLSGKIPPTTATK